MLQTYIRLSNKRLFLPLYHLVSNEKANHLKYLYHVKTIKEFKQELDLILKYFSPVSIQDIIVAAQNRIPIKENSVFFTFDDGLKEMRDVVAPILLEKGVEAAFFVNPDFVNNKDLFYRYKAGLLIDEIEKTNLTNATANYLTEVLKSKKHRQAILNIDYQNKEDLDKIAGALDLDFNEFLTLNTPYLFKHDLKWLINKGFAVGAHSMDHPRFFDINEQEQVRQAADSIKWVKENFKQAYNLFAFPFSDYGIKQSFFNSLKTRVNIDLSFGCAGIKDDEILSNLQRLPMDDTKLPINQHIKIQYRNYLLKKLIGKHKIVRH